MSTTPKAKPTLTNEVRITARLATTPERRGNGPFKFRIGHGGGGKRRDGSHWPTQWFSVACWSESEIEGLAKGASVEIVGKLRDSTYTSSDGSVKYGVEIVSERIIREQAEPQPAPLTPNQTQTNGTAIARAILRPAAKAGDDFDVDF